MLSRLMRQIGFGIALISIALAVKILVSNTAVADLWIIGIHVHLELFTR